MSLSAAFNVELLDPKRLSPTENPNASLIDDEDCASGRVVAVTELDVAELFPAVSYAEMA